MLAITIWERDQKYLDRNPFMINFMPQYTNQSAYGIERSSEKGKEGRTHIKYSPLDIDPETIDQVKDKELIVGKGKRIIVPPGDWSGHKSMGFYLPPTAEDFPDTLKNHEIGKMFMHWVEIKNAINSELDSVKEGSKRKDEILKKLGDGELSKEHLQLIGGLQKDLIKMASEGRSRDKTNFNNSFDNQRSQ
jgi:hypothetical protein